MSTLMVSSPSLPNSYSINVPSFLPLRFSSFASISASPKLNEFRLSKLAVTPKKSEFRLTKLAVTPKKSAIVCPVRAQVSDQSSPDYVPDAKIFKVEAILGPWKVRTVALALVTIGIGGLTVSEVGGFGAQGGVRLNPMVTGLISKANFEAKVKMETVVRKDQVEAVIDTIISESRTGEIGDGKIFVTPVSDIIRVRTDERGDKAVKLSDVPAGKFTLPRN